jgi:BNR repeat-containing family member
MALAEGVALGEFSLLPASANNVSNCNSLPFTQDALATQGERQYAIWVSGPERAPLIAARVLPDGEWSQPVDLQKQPGSPFEVPTKLDPHHSYALGVDALGRVHVAGNLHNEPLRYMRSELGDLTRWSAEPMIGEEEASVTYPAFVSLSDGTLLFVFRDGRAGFGDVYLNRLPPHGGWERLGMLIEGRATDESPYLNHIAVSVAGDLHVSGCFRERGGRAASNRDIWHALSVDGGRSCRSAAGEPLELPLGHDSVPIAVPTPSSGSGLVNQTGMDVDPTGNPHIAFFRYDGSGAPRSSTPGTRTVAGRRATSPTSPTGWIPRRRSSTPRSLAPPRPALGARSGRSSVPPTTGTAAARSACAARRAKSCGR